MLHISLKICFVCQKIKSFKKNPALDLSLFFLGLLFCKRTNANIIHETLCRRERRHTAYRWVTHCSRRITLPPLGWETLRILMYVKPPPGSDAARPCSKVTKCKLCCGASVWNRLIIEIEKEEWERGWEGGFSLGVGSRVQFFLFFLAACDSNGGDLNVANRVMLTRGLPGSTFACGNLAGERARRRAPVGKRKVIQGASRQVPSTRHYLWQCDRVTSLFLYKQKAENIQKKKYYLLFFIFDLLLSAIWK